MTLGPPSCAILLLNAKESNFFPGEQVLLKIQKVANPLLPKMYDKFDGPYYIREKCPNDTYRIVHASTHKPHPNKVNATHLKNYFDPEDYRAQVDDPEPPIEIPETHNPDPNLPAPLGNPRQELPHPKPTINTESAEGEPSQIKAPRPDKRTPKVKGPTEDPQEDAPEPPDPNLPVQTPEPVSEQVWHQTLKPMKLKRQGGKSWYLVKREGNDVPSWQPEENISPFLKRQFHLTHTKQGKQRKHKNQYFR